MNDISAFVDFNVFACLPNNNNEPEDFITHINGKILTYGDSGRRISIGKVSLIYCNLNEALNNGISALDAMDGNSQSTCDLFCSLFDIETDNPKSDLLNLLGYKDGLRDNSNLLIINRIEILPKYRGQGLSKSIIEQSIVMFGNKTFAQVLKPFPLQQEPQNTSERESAKAWHKRMSYKLFKENEQDAKTDLLNHYKNLGFVEIKDTEYMVYLEEYLR